MKRHCLDCDELTTNGSRCPHCDQRNHQAAYGGDWRGISRRQRRQVPYCECTGCPLHSGHCTATADLTVDHLKPHAHGGTAADGVRTLCRRCNSSRQDRR